MSAQFLFPVPVYGRELITPLISICDVDDNSGHLLNTNTHQNSLYSKIDFCTLIASIRLANIYSIVVLMSL